MSNLASLLSHGQLKRGLLVCAETNSLNRSPKDKTVKPLFGDAATVTALEYDAEYDKPLQFSFGVDGSGYKAVWTEYGGTRNPITPESIQEKEVAPGVIRRGIDMVVNGMDVFSFAIKVPPRSLLEFVEHFNINVDDIDYLFLHQANKFIDDRIRKRLKLPEEKVPLCLQDYGNTNSASIPLAMVTCKAEELMTGDNDCLGCGFGVGLAWGTIHYHADKLKSVVFTEYNRLDYD
jgi:3-oxoacyl-[acyl-carrier-protein] synthase-3